MGISFWSILAAILILGLLVTIHEFGHYIVARLLKIRVYELSIFVGPVLFSWRKNDIDYSIRAFPFGAYVRFSDVDEEGNMLDQDDPALLCNQKRWKAFLTAMAGPFMNLVLGVLIFTCIFCYIGVTTTRLTIPPGYSQYWYYLQESGNINIGDEVLAVNGSKVYTFIDMDFTINERISKVKPATLTMRSRETGEIYDFTLEPIVDHGGERLPAVPLSPQGCVCDVDTPELRLPAGDDVRQHDPPDGDRRAFVRFRSFFGQVTARLGLQQDRELLRRRVVLVLKKLVI